MIFTYRYLDVLKYLHNVCFKNQSKMVFGVGFFFKGMLLARALGYNPDSIPENFIDRCGICYPVCLQSTCKYGESNLGGIYPRYSIKNVISYFLKKFKHNV